MDDIEKARLLDKLSREYGETLLPASRVCTAFFEWFHTIEKLTDEEMDRFQGHHIKDKQAVRDVMNKLPMWVMKSAYLLRLVYYNEPPRKEKCPVHNGHWSGCAWGKGCDCQKVKLPDGTIAYDSNVYGWLLEGNPAVTAPCGFRTIQDAPAEGYVRVCVDRIDGHTDGSLNSEEHNLGPWTHYQTGEVWKEK